MSDLRVHGFNVATCGCHIVDPEVHFQIDEVPSDVLSWPEVNGAV